MLIQDQRVPATHLEHDVDLLSQRVGVHQGQLQGHRVGVEKRARLYIHTCANTHTKREPLWLVIQAFLGPWEQALACFRETKGRFYSMRGHRLGLSGTRLWSDTPLSKTHTPTTNTTSHIQTHLPSGEKHGRENGAKHSDRKRGAIGDSTHTHTILVNGLLQQRWWG